MAHFATYSLSSSLRKYSNVISRVLHFFHLFKMWQSLIFVEFPRSRKKKQDQARETGHALDEAEPPEAILCSSQSDTIWSAWAEQET